MNIYDYTEQKKISLRRVIDFTVLTNPVGPSQKAKNAMRKSLKAVALFPDARTPYLRRAIARREGIDADNILFGPGVTGILELLFALVKPRRILVPLPLPPHYARLCEKHGLQVIAFPRTIQEPFSIDIAALVDAASDADMLVIPNPHSVTGRIIAGDELQELVRALRGIGKLVVVDESLVEFTGTRYSPAGIIDSTHGIVLRSFSLFHSLAGLRLGYACANRALLDRLVAVVDCSPHSNVAAAGALASLNDKGFYRKTEQFLAAEKDYLSKKMARVQNLALVDTCCNFVLIKMAGALPDLPTRFLQRNMLVDTFADTHGTSFIRLPIRKHQDNARFIKTLERIVA